MAENVSVKDSKHDLDSILSSPNRDFLVRNNGDQVNINSLKGNIVGLYFSASWCGPCRRFTPNLVEAYNELKQPGKEFEIVYISGDKDEASFDEYFPKMPWLAVPFSDSETRKRLKELFSVRGIPHFIILDKNGKVLTDEGVKIINEHGGAFPFDSEHIQKLKELEEEARKNQTLKSLLVSPSRDYAITSDGTKVPIAELEGKTVGLYFGLLTYNACLAFNQKLVEVYKSLKEEGEEFEIVMITLDEDESSFQKEFENLPWLSLPLKDKCVEKLFDYFNLGSIPTVVIIGPDGKTLHSNVVESIEEHGKKAYPFTPAKFAELDEAKREAQTLDLHPKCALNDGESGKRGEDGEENRGEGWICDGDKCYRE